MVLPIKEIPSGKPNLREMKINEVIESYGKDRDWWNSLSPNEQNMEIANAGVGRAFGTIRAVHDPNNPYHKHDAETLQMDAESYGFKTVQDYTTALVKLRNELQAQLAPNVFDTFFGTTLDIT